MGAGMNYAAGFRMEYSQWTASSNTEIDGSGTLVQLIAGASTGTIVKEIKFKSVNTVNDQCTINIFMSFDGGTTKALFHQMYYQVSGLLSFDSVIASEEATIQNLDIFLPNDSAIMYFAVGDSGSTRPINAFVTAADF